ncbi:MAG: tyrosine-type recombinase/integrase [Magnetococcales bacterium]|nr:tyrosine-type recombinase/integrase [Magnetococcales bacterium]
MMSSSSGETPRGVDGLTVEAALGVYLEQVSSRKSLESHEREVRKARQITARLGRIPLRELTPLDVSEYRDHRLREASAGIVQGDLALLQELFEVAVRTWGLVLEGNPLHGVSPPRPPPGRERSFERGELVRLLAACDRRPTPMLGWIVRIAMQTAMSKDDILRLRKGDLDLVERVVTLPRLLSRPRRQIPLTREAVRVFREVLVYPERPEDEELLFFGAMGKLGIRSPLAIDKALRMVLLQARMKGFRFNDLRNEALTRMAAAGLSESEILTIAGLPFPRQAKRPPRPAVGELVARMDAVGFGV